MTTGSQPRGRFSQLRKVFIGIALASLGLLMLVIIIAIVSEDMDEDGLRFMGALVSILMGSLMMLGNAIVFERRGFHLLPLCASIAVVGAVVLTIAMILDEPHDYTLFPKFGFSFITCGVALSLAAQLLLLESRHAWLRIATRILILMIIAFAALTCAFIWEVIDIEDRSNWGPSWVFLYLELPLGAMTLLGLIVIPLTTRLTERGTVAAAESIDAKVALEMSCPRCGESATFRNGPGRCKPCGFLMMIEIEEPRCECGYLLYQLASDVCPECGRPVPEDQRWLGQARE
ncbi:MAG: hypothetical protein ACR2GY_03000 [Phycisphaerales bacterium]